MTLALSLLAALLYVLVVVVLWRAQSRPLTSTDVYCSQVDSELDRRAVLDAMGSDLDAIYADTDKSVWGAQLYVPLSYRTIEHQLRADVAPVRADVMDSSDGLGT